MVLVVLVVLVVLEGPGPEIRILREISSPEPAGNVREAPGKLQNVHFIGLRRLKNITVKKYFGPKYVLIFFPAVVLVVLGVVFLVPVAVARCATFTYTKTTPRSTKTTTRTTKTNKNKTKNKTKTKQKHCLGRPGVVLGWFWRGNFS